MDIVTIFCDIDDFCCRLLATRYPQLKTGSSQSQRRAAALTLSEILTILVFFHVSHYRTFKHL